MNSSRSYCGLTQGSGGWIFAEPLQCQERRFEHFLVKVFLKKKLLFSPSDRSKFR